MLFRSPEGGYGTSASATTAMWVAATLAIVGALNWGLVAIAEFDLVAEIFGLEFGETNAATRVVYGLVGLAGLALVALLPRRTAR